MIHEPVEREQPLPDIEDVRAAEARIRRYISRTPVLQSGTLDLLTKASLHFKCENFQRSGAFKARGAHNAVFALSMEDAQRGVVTHSSGNHGAALALAARSRGIPAYVVAPENAVPSKIENIRRYGGNVVFCRPTLADRETAAARIVEDTGARLIHSYDNCLVVAGQGTAVVELLEDHDVDVVVAPVGGGGLLGGTALAAKALRPGIVVIGAEPEMADDAFRSFRQGKLIRQENPQTVADGLRTSLSPLTFALIRKYVDDIVPVSERAIVEALRLIWSVLKIIAEPSSAVPLAAVLTHASSALFAGKRIGIIVTGGNVELQCIASLLMTGGLRH